MSRYALTASERSDLVRRSDDLRRALTPATTDEIRTSLLKWVAGLHLSHNEEALDDMVSMFVASLMGLPLWAIRQTLLNWMQGTIADCNPRFTPKPPELRREGNRIVGAYQRELGTIEAGLKADVETVPTQSERDKALAYWTDELRPTMGHADVTNIRNSDGSVYQPTATEGRPDEHLRRQGERQAQIEANDRLRRRELEAAGANPSQPYTPALAAKIESIRAQQEQSQRDHEHEERQRERADAAPRR